MVPQSTGGLTSQQGVELKCSKKLEAAAENSGAGWGVGPLSSSPVMAGPRVGLLCRGSGPLGNALGSQHWLWAPKPQRSREASQQAPVTLPKEKKKRKKQGKKHRATGYKFKINCQNSKY